VIHFLNDHCVILANALLSIFATTCTYGSTTSAMLY
jgi:hypothetical protein